MSEPSQQPLPLETARLERERAEGAKLREEEAKLRAERREIELRLAKPWYRRDGFFKALVGGLLALPVMWFFFDQIIRPVYTVENKKLWVDVEEARLEVRRKEQDLKEALAELEAARRELEAAWAVADAADAALQKREADLEVQQARLVADYERLLADERSSSAELAQEIERLKAGLTATRGATANTLEIHDNWLQSPDVSFVATPLTSRPMVPKTLFVHPSDSNSLTSTAALLSKPESRQTEHILIGRDGKIVQMLAVDQAPQAERATPPDGELTGPGVIRIAIINAGRLDRQGETYRAWFGKEIAEEDVLPVLGASGGSTTYWHKPTPAQLRTLEAIAGLLVASYPIETIVGRDEIGEGLGVEPSLGNFVRELRKRLLPPAR